MEIIRNDYYSDNKDYIFAKVIMAGEVSSGKTFLMKRIHFYEEKSDFSKLDKNYVPTIGADFALIRLKIYDRLFKIQLWDISGQERFKNLIYYYAKGSSPILIFYNSSDRNSFYKAKEIYKNLYELNSNSIYALIRSKYDLNCKNEKELNNFVSDEEALEFANQNNIIFFHLSCFEKYETGINELFTLIFSKFIKTLKI